MEILLITVDCLRPDRLGIGTSPCFDALAARGVLFEQAIAQAPWTSPGLFSLLTGCHPPAHGVTTRGGRLSASLASLPRHLRAAGWEAPDVCYLNQEESYARLGWGPRLDFEEALEIRSERRLLWTHYERCHLPYRGTPPDPRLQPLHDLGVIPRGSFELGPEDRRAVLSMYDAGVAAWDEWLGQVLDVWAERGPVVITADHGEELLEHGWIGHPSTAGSPSLFHETLHIPLLIVAPGVPPRRVSTRVRQIDVMPTLCELAGLDPPSPLEGRTLLPLMHGVEEVDRTAYAETVYAGYRTPPGRSPHRTRALYHDAWKLVVSPEGRQLYDRRHDPDERHDVSGAHPDVAAALQAQVIALSRSSRALWSGEPRSGAPLAVGWEDGALKLPDERRYEVEYQADDEVAGTLYAHGPHVAFSPLPRRVRARSAEGDDDWSDWAPDSPTLPA